MVTNKEMTICTECVHLLNTSSGHGVWYEHLCKADKLSINIDPFDGREKTNTGNGYGYCRDYNKGDCKDFERNLFTAGKIVTVVNTDSLPADFLGRYGRIRDCLRHKVEVEFNASVGGNGSLAHTAFVSDLKIVR